MRHLFLLVAILVICSPGYAEKLDLKEAIQLVLKEEASLKVKEYEEVISRYESATARSALLPKLELTVGGAILSHEPTARNVALGRPIEVPTSEKEFYTYSLTLRQLIFDFFGARTFYESKKVAEEIKQLELESLRNLVLYKFLKLYFDLKETERMIEVLEKEVERLEGHLRDAESLFQEGVITKNELLYTQVLLSDARQRLINAKNGRRLIISAINKMLGRNLNQELSFDDIKRKPEISEISDHYYDEALKNRIELRIIDKAKNQIELLKVAKKSDLYPKFFLEGKYTYTENRYQVYEGIGSLALGMTLNLFDGGKTRTELKILDLEQMKIRAEEKRIKEDIRLEIEKYYTDFKNAMERMKVMELSVKQAEENLRITKVRYKEGVGTGTEVLDAISALTLSETNYQRAYYDLLRAELGLNYATGKKLEEEYSR